MLHYPSVRDAVFACCACNKHVLLNDNRHKNAALHYYSKAVHKLNQTLANFQPTGKQPDSSLLTTVVFLYVHDVCAPRSYMVFTRAEVSYSYGASTTRSILETTSPVP